MAYHASIVADSISEWDERLTTMEVTFPRIVLAEFNTHRAFSRNSASSRAIPVARQLERIMDDPFIPVWWGKQQPGMQADEELEDRQREWALSDWLAARDRAVETARSLMELGLHKQIANRLLEPWMWQTVIVTATDWGNFFALRANPMAQPEIRTIAEIMQELYETSQPTPVHGGEWHLPLIQPEERDGVFEHTEEALKISAARCARVSYLTHDGRRDLAADLALYERLVGGGHMSPLEHVATPNHFRQEGNFYGWKQLRKFIPHENDFSQVGQQG